MWGLDSLGSLLMEKRNGLRCENLQRREPSCALGVYYNYRHYNPIDEGFASYRYEHDLTEWFKWF